MIININIVSCFTIIIIIICTTVITIIAVSITAITIIAIVTIATTSPIVMPHERGVRPDLVRPPRADANREEAVGLFGCARSFSR